MRARSIIKWVKRHPQIYEAIRKKTLKESREQKIEISGKMDEHEKLACAAELQLDTEVIKHENGTKEKEKVDDGAAARRPA